MQSKLSDNTLPLKNKTSVDSECRVFKEKWTENYLFTKVNAKPVCLVCNQQVAVFKEFNIRRHFETHRKDKNDHLIGKIRKNEMKRIPFHLLSQYVG